MHINSISYTGRKLGKVVRTYRDLDKVFICNSIRVSKQANMSKWLVENFGDKLNWDFFFHARGVRYDHVAGPWWME